MGDGLFSSPSLLSAQWVNSAIESAFDARLRPQRWTTRLTCSIISPFCRSKWRSAFSNGSATCSLSRFVIRERANSKRFSSLRSRFSLASFRWAAATRAYAFWLSAVCRLCVCKSANICRSIARRLREFRRSPPPQTPPATASCFARLSAQLSFIVASIWRQASNLHFAHTNIFSPTHAGRIRRSALCCSSQRFSCWSSVLSLLWRRRNRCWPVALRFLFAIYSIEIVRRRSLGSPTIWLWPLAFLSLWLWVFYNL